MALTRVLSSGLFSTFSNGITEIDLYRLTADFSTNASTMTGWERPDDGHFAKLGTGMSEASGIFTFPSTGLWRIDGHWQLLCAANDSVVVHVSVSQDSGSNYDEIGETAISSESGSAVGNTATTPMFVDVTNTSTVKVKFAAESYDQKVPLTKDQTKIAKEVYKEEIKKYDSFNDWQRDEKNKYKVSDIRQGKTTLETKATGIIKDDPNRIIAKAPRGSGKQQ